MLRLLSSAISDLTRTDVHALAHQLVFCFAKIQQEKATERSMHE